MASRDDQFLLVESDLVDQEAQVGFAEA